MEGGGREESRGGEEVLGWSRGGSWCLKVVEERRREEGRSRMARLV